MLEDEVENERKNDTSADCFRSDFEFNPPRDGVSKVIRGEKLKKLLQRRHLLSVRKLSVKNVKETCSCLMGVNPSDCLFTGL